MSKIRVLCVMAMSPFFMTKGVTAENWFEKTWKEYFPTEAKDTLNPGDLQFDASHMTNSITTHQSLLPQYQSNSPQFATPSNHNSAYPQIIYTPYESLPTYSINGGDAYHNDGQSFEMSQRHQSVPLLQPVYRPQTNSQAYSQPGITTNATTTQTKNRTNTDPEALLLATYNVNQQQTFYRLRPPVLDRFISKEEIELMKQDKASTDYLLDLMFWEIVPCSYTRDQVVRNKHIYETLKNSPDHRLWRLIDKLEIYSDFPGLVEKIKEYADQGLATAQWMMGVMYSYGRGVSQKDLSRAVDYYSLSAAQGFASAQNDLGNLYHDYATGKQGEIFGLHQLAADQGLVFGKLNLGVCYENGTYVEKSLDQALKLYFEANLERCSRHITDILSPIKGSARNNFFSQRQFFETINEKLILMLSIYSPDALCENKALLTEKQRVKTEELRSMIYERISKEALPLIDTLQMVSPGFLIDCLKGKEGVDMNPAKKNPAPAFYGQVHLGGTTKYYISLGENNCVIKDEFVKVINFFHLDVKRAVEKALEIGDIDVDREKVEADIKKLEEEHRALEPNLTRLKVLMEKEVSVEKKAIYAHKILEIECDISLKEAELNDKRKDDILMLRWTGNLMKFDEIYNLLRGYVEKGAFMRNELFLENYPYLRARETK